MNIIGNTQKWLENQKTRDDSIEFIELIVEKLIEFNFPMNITNALVLYIYRFILKLMKIHLKKASLNIL